MLQIRSRLDVADNTGARMAKMIGVIGKKNSPEAHVGDVIHRPRPRGQCRRHGEEGRSRPCGARTHAAADQA